MSEHEHEQEYQATSENWIQFKESAVWLDMKLFLERRLATRRDALEEVDPESLEYLQAECAVTREMLNIPDDFILHLTEGD